MKKIKIVLKKQNVRTKEIYEENLEFDENITFLNLSYKDLIEIPKGLEQFKQLKQLYLNNNQISKIQFLTADGKPFNENLDNLINLTRLDLDYNQITKIENLDNLINLKILYLYDNQINKIENLDNLINLKILYLQNNQINKIENLDNSINLEKLYLNGNKITKIENLDNNINLNALYLNNNNITKIENIHHLEKLEYLYVFYENQSENIKEDFKISLNNYNLELKEIQIQQELLKLELLKQEKMKQDKEYFNNNFKKLHQQFIQSNIKNDNDLLI